MEKYQPPDGSRPDEFIDITPIALLGPNGEVFLEKRTDDALAFPGFYQLFGGFFNYFEDDSLEDCVWRELKEETSLDQSNLLAMRPIENGNLILPPGPYSPLPRRFTYHEGLIDKFDFDTSEGARIDIFTLDELKDRSDLVPSTEHWLNNLVSWDYTLVEANLPTGDIIYKIRSDQELHAPGQLSLPGGLRLIRNFQKEPDPVCAKRELNEDSDIDVNRIRFLPINQFETAPTRTIPRRRQFSVLRSIVDTVPIATEEGAEFVPVPRGQRHQQYEFCPSTDSYYTEVQSAA